MAPSQGQLTSASMIVPMELEENSHGSNTISIGDHHQQEDSLAADHHHHRLRCPHPFPKMVSAVPVPLIKKVMAEFIGTFILMFTQVSTIIMDEKHGGVEGLMGIAVAVGLTVAVLVMSTIHISGCHLNPAVSVAMAVFGHLPGAHLAPYVVAQVMGSVAASFTGKAIYHPIQGGIATVPSVGAGEAFAVEFIITFVLLFVITAVATDPRAVKEPIGVAVGATIVMNILVAGPSTGASMNPARTIGPAIVTGRYRNIWVYLVPTPLGAIAGTGAYVAIKL